MVHEAGVRVEWDVVVVVHRPWDTAAGEAEVLVVEVRDIAMDHRGPMNQEEEEVPRSMAEAVGVPMEEEVMVPMEVVEVEVETGVPIEVEERGEAVAAAVTVIQDANDIVRVVEVQSVVTHHVQGIKLVCKRNRCKRSIAELQVIIDHKVLLELKTFQYFRSC
jgi:hypothetical protein